MNHLDAMRDLLARLSKIEDWDKLVEMMAPQNRQALLEALQKRKS